MWRAVGRQDRSSYGGMDGKKEDILQAINPENTTDLQKE